MNELTYGVMQQIGSVFAHLSSQAFGIGAFEDDDDDIYDTDHLSNYNRVVDSAVPTDSLFGWTGAQTGTSGLYARLHTVDTQLCRRLWGEPNSLDN